MFDRNASPIENRPVYKRIGINETRHQRSGITQVQTTWEICDALMKKHEAERIWQLVKETAQGTCMPISSSSSNSSPIDCDITVCADGWEAA